MHFIGMEKLHKLRSTSFHDGLSLAADLDPILVVHVCATAHLPIVVIARWSS